MLVFPKVKYKLVADYHEVQEKFLPEVAAMRDENPANNETTEQSVIRTSAAITG